MEEIIKILDELNKKGSRSRAACGVDKSLCSDGIHPKLQWELLRKLQIPIDSWVEDENIINVTHRFKRYSTSMVEKFGLV